MSTLADLTLPEVFFKKTGHPNKSQIGFMLSRGTPAMALAHDADGDGYAVGVAKVEKVGRRFEFSDDGVNALVVIARDEDGEPADLVAWLPNGGWFGPWFGALPLLGMHDLFAPRLTDPLAVFLDPLDWYRAGRAGVVILDRKRAWSTLEGVTVATVSIDEGDKLRTILTPPKPKIVISNKNLERLAA